MGRMTHADRHHWLESPNFTVNEGVEALLGSGAGPVALAENGYEAIAFDPPRRIAIEGNRRWISDATRLADGRAVVVLRSVGAAGIEGWLALIDETSRPMRIGPAVRIAAGPLTNLEGAAAEPRPHGVTRLWLVSDNDFWPIRDTVLMAIDLPPGWAPPTDR